MIPCFSSMKILIICPIPVIDTLQNIFCSMSMHYIYYNLYSPSVSFVNQLFKFVWFAKFTRHTEKIADVIPKRSIVRMFEYGHELYHIVPSFLHHWKYKILKMSIRMNFRLLPTHSDMTLVDFNVLVGPWWLWVFKFIIS